MSGQFYYTAVWYLYHPVASSKRGQDLSARDFAESAPGRLVSQSGPSGDFLAYVPDPLPKSITMGMRTIALLSRADQALGELKGVGQMLPNPNLLIIPSRTDERR
jgi:hypothetical protein